MQNSKLVQKSSWILFFVAIFLLTGGVYWWKSSTQAVSGEKISRSFVIPKGYSASQIGNKLKKKGFIKSALAFKLYVQFTDRSQKIQAGEYQLSPSLSLSEIVNRLISGPTEIWVTIPEGLRREEIVEEFINRLGREGAAAVEFRQNFLALSKNKEGFLFPDTYLFPKDATAKLVIDKMVKTFESKTNQIRQIDLEDKPISSLKEAVILASIIEREAFGDQERPVIAGILLNRLAIGMGLQTDATVQYAVASEKCRTKIECNWWPILTRSDMRIDSPFNTYKYRGLPPHSIANPGIASIKAVFYSKKTDYLYYLHDASGKIHYARNLREHNENIAKYLR